LYPKLTEDESDVVQSTLRRLFGWNSPVMFRNVLCGHKVRCEWKTDCVKSTMWKYVIKTSGMHEVMNCVRSNEFIESAATVAFMNMRPLCGRDVAGIIARMVAMMYLDDYAWMRTMTQRGANGKKPCNDTMLEYKIRERITMWL
jgi:hypothetical protein